MTCLEGSIVGYNLRRHLDLEDESINAIVEYPYMDKIYKHINTSSLQTLKESEGNTCNIYIDQKRKRIYDEFELSTPIRFFSKPTINLIFLHKIKQMIIDAVKEAREEKKSTKELREKLKSSPQIPLKTYEYNPKPRKRWTVDEIDTRKYG
jgi:hypothetical protein